MVKLYTPKILLVIVSILLATAFFFGCKKNNFDVPFINGNPPDLTTEVKSSVSGFVTDENNAAMNLATVKVGTAIVTTDKYGYFEVKNIDVIKNAAVVTVTKPGYFKGIKTYIAEEGKSAFFRIKLIPKTNAGTVNATAGGAVTLTNGLSISLPANAVVNAVTNAAYTGTVNIAAYWLDPTAADLSSTMPGDLRGLNIAGNLQLLTTYGMAAVELTGSGGETLQIAPGKKAILSLPIPASLLSLAPATIPLWYFDEAKGLWKQEGTATKTGSKYVGEVSHFSFWNWDVPGNFVQLTATIVNNSNQPVQNALVKISVVGNPANTRYGYTNTAGYVGGLVPANSQLLLEVLANYNCTNAAYSQNITTTTINIALGNVAITNVTSLATITGNVVNCTNAPVTNGYIVIRDGARYIRKNLSNTGTYSINLIVCNNTNNTVVLVAEDLTAQQASFPITINITSGNNIVPPIQACGIELEFIHLTVNGNVQHYETPRDRIIVHRTNVTDIGITYLPIPYVMYGTIYFTGTGIAVGSTQTLTQFSIPQIIANLTPNNPPVNVSITEYGAIGQFIAGNFAGIFTGPPNNTQYNITSSFRVRRIF